MAKENPEMTQLRQLQQENLQLKSTLSLLHWDQETFLPSKGVDWRSGQIAQLSGLVHDKETSKELKDLFETLGVNRETPEGNGSNEFEKALLRQSWREFDQATCFPREYVMEKSALLSQAYSAWAEAREQNQFSHFLPWLEKVVDYAKRDADYLGYQDHPYDALLDLYEPGMKTSELKEIFSPMGDELAKLVKEISQKPQVREDFLTRSVDPKIQEEIGQRVLTEMGYDFERGRLDVSAHPFTIELGPQDIRITTHYAENRFALSLYGTIHEGGHALYEMGISEDLAGTPLGQGVSLGVHESQSRYWENLVCRSREFCRHFLPYLKEKAPAAFGDVTEEEYYSGINRVKPSLIRIEADEVTYSLHILLRFNLELALIEGKLKVADLPEAWREESKKLLGIAPQKDSLGVLQDIHWSGGSFGYFPTYALGNLYGAQFLKQMTTDIPDWKTETASGELSGVHQWLRKNIHSRGSLYPARELCKKVTGEPLNPRYFIDYLKKKYTEIYSL